MNFHKFTTNGIGAIVVARAYHAAKEDPVGALYKE